MPRWRWSSSRPSPSWSTGDDDDRIVDAQRPGGARGRNGQQGRHAAVDVLDRAAIERQGRGGCLVEWIGVLAGGDGVGEGQVLVPLPLV